MRLILRALLAMLVSFSLGVAANADEPQLPSGFPPVLKKFLQQNSVYHLLRLSDISHEDLRQPFSGGALAPFQLADTTHSGNKDLVAVVVRDGRFSLLIWQARNGGFSETPQWLVRESAYEIGGVIINDDYIVPAYCYGCENPETYAWTGSEYGKNVVLPGQFVCLTYDTIIYSKPDKHSRIIFKTQEPFGADVIELGKPLGDLHWHKVRLRGKHRLAGFVTNDNFSDYDCAELKD